MKNLFLLFALLPISLFGMQTPQNITSITKAISDGNADALAAYFDSNVEIAILDDEDVYSKAEAIKVVKGFFSKNKPNSFSQVHQGSSKGKDSQYCIGNMETSNGQFRVYVYLKVSGNNTSIKELRFDKP